MIIPYVCYLVVLAMTLCYSGKLCAQDTRPYMLGHVDSPLTDEDISTAKSILGIETEDMEIEQFRFELPRSRVLRFSSYRYLNGKEHLKVTTLKRFRASSGENELMLVKYRTNKDDIRFGFTLGDGQHLTTGITATRDDTRFTVSHSFTHGKLETRKKTPFYVLAADPYQVTEFGKNESDMRIKEYIKENKWVWIAYIELR